MSNTVINSINPRLRDLANESTKELSAHDNLELVNSVKALVPNGAEPIVCLLQELEHQVFLVEKVNEHLRKGEVIADFLDENQQVLWFVGDKDSHTYPEIILNYLKRIAP